MSEIKSEYAKITWHMTDQKMEVLYMSLYSAGYEEFVDEVLQNGCNGIVEKMRKSSKEKLFPVT